MAELIITLEIMTPLLLLLGLGWLLRRIGWMKEDLVTGMNALIFKLFLPVLLFNNMRDLDMSITPPLSFMLFVFCSIVFVFVAAYVLVPRFEKNPRKSGVIVQGIFRTNYAILGIPLLEAMFGAPGVMAATLALPIVVPVNNALAVVALSTCAGHKADPKQLIKNIITNPLIIGTVLGAAFLLLKIPVPGVVDDALRQVGRITSPLSLLVLGASLRWQGVADNRKQLTWMLILRQGIVPAVMVSLAALLGFHHEELGVMIILFGAPCAVSCFAMADAMGGDSQLAASQVVMSTVFSMGTLFVLIYVGKLLAIL